MRPAVSPWFSVSGKLNDDGNWHLGIFRALMHRVLPDAYKVSLEGRVFFFSLCGSPVVKRTEPTDYLVAKCPKCLRRP
ncbi:hypothetical protein BJ970_004274 [Saccharopolyspora phatthalungensis]|uniref:Uncharacterized protein n=1 Tax=Saccharopolyspora phatthalungensis TaxID=664693 RepID=A0A840QA80_9PSEU|nr:hypothetical protein [Saccharopolyspora phatthalungensis]